MSITKKIFTVLVWGINDVDLSFKGKVEMETNSPSILFLK